MAVCQPSLGPSHHQAVELKSTTNDNNNNNKNLFMS